METYPEKAAGQALLRAIYQRNTAEALRLLDRGADINASTNRGWTPLLRAVQKQMSDLALRLIERGADVHAVTRSKRGALHWAAQYGTVELVASLLETEGICASAEDRHGYTPLWLAAAHGRREIVRLFLQRGEWPERTRAYYWSPAKRVAARGGHLNVLRAFLDAGFNLNKDLSNGTIRWGDDYNIPLLVRAVRLGRKPVLRFLLEQGADPNQCSGQYRSALSVALERGDDETIRLLQEYGAVAGLRDAVMGNDLALAKRLLAEGANVEATLDDWRGTTLLSLAASNRRADMVRLLVEWGEADVNHTDKYKRTALFCAAQTGDLALVEYLVQRGGNPLANDGENTVLAAAASGGHLHIVDWMLSRYGVQPETAGPAALAAAAEQGHGIVVRRLLDAGVDPNRCPRIHGRNALVCAAWGGREEIVRLLLERGARTDVFDYKWQTALWHAAAAGQHRCVRVLLEHGVSQMEKDRALRIALEGERAKVAQLLLEQGANPDTFPPGTTQSQFRRWAAAESRKNASL